MAERRDGFAELRRRSERVVRVSGTPKRERLQPAHEPPSATGAVPGAIEELAPQIGAETSAATAETTISREESPVSVLDVWWMPLVGELPTIQISMRVRPAADARLAECLHALRRVGIRRPQRVELLELLLARLPVEPGPELDQLIKNLRTLRGHAPRSGAEALRG